MEGVKARVLADPPKPSTQLSVETVQLSLLYAFKDSRSGTLRPETEQVLSKLWARQIKEGNNKGSWNWYNLNLDPWETQVSPFYAASLAALAVGAAPHYATQPAIQEIAAMKSFLATHEDSQPLQNRLLLLWASIKMPDLLTKTQRELLLKEVWDKQEADGGWSSESFGAWNKHPDAPSQSGSNSYATAFIAFALERAGVSPNDKRLSRSLRWLQQHQDSPGGYWDAQSLNKQFPQGSMEIQFMRDAATSFAALALLDSDPSRRP